MMKIIHLLFVPLKFDHRLFLNKQKVINLVLYHSNLHLFSFQIFKITKSNFDILNLFKIYGFVKYNID